ncbi:hypothetical protein [Levilinea saccharolytica]|uniref:Uncharacterized protein n=1 Tax=Levilinea saccharolytica TaxID=229921 RepID=A0A0P6XTF9_9CHLR|nr:hypothetical protein [Levilinea saccharolytica]KPL83564.1 hypothetical protein ADN01_07560 [Levilinea saccharolytica]GAP18602.1 hypothetical protein LSAC_02500 [Levilinea saccharolytica]
MSTIGPTSLSVIEGLALWRARPFGDALRLDFGAVVADPCCGRLDQTRGSYYIEASAPWHAQTPQNQVWHGSVSDQSAAAALASYLASCSDSDNSVQTAALTAAHTLHIQLASGLTLEIDSAAVPGEEAWRLASGEPYTRPLIFTLDLPG